MGDEKLKIWDVFERIRSTKKHCCGLRVAGCVMKVIVLICVRISGENCGG